jgi:prepilin-type N-terminal cleavage/methylation domain-containing protein
MRELIILKSVLRKRRSASFTLIELLTVMAIIALLAALVLSSWTGIQQRVSRSRAASEIQGMTTALDAYKADKGGYPPSDGVLTTNSPYSAYDGTSVNYQTNSQLLYRALSGQTNFTSVPTTGTNTYINFKVNQVGNYQAGPSELDGGSTYLKDPWGYSYGYSTGNTTVPFYPNSGQGLFDIWSTGGLLQGNANFTKPWISNWQ